MIALVDGDAIVYASGFASDQRFYVVGGSDFKYKKDAVDYCVGMGIDPSTIELTVVPEPISHCLQTTKEMISKIVRESGADDYRVYLSGKGNFRKDIAVSAPYKGNRDETHKPFYYEDIRQYLIDKWNGIVVNGMEADDAMGIAQCDDYYTSTWDDSYGTIICSPDKDMNMIPGYHYNWKNGEKYFVNESEALRVFYTQLLVGDPSDNIYGLYGIGPKKAAKILEGCLTDYDMWCEVRQAYFYHGLNPNIIKKETTTNGEGQIEGDSGVGSGSSGNSEGCNPEEDKVDGGSCHGSEDEILSWLYENANLLWIMRNEYDSDNPSTWIEPKNDRMPF